MCNEPVLHYIQGDAFYMYCITFKVMLFIPSSLLCAPTPRVGALSDDARLTSVCLTSDVCLRLTSVCRVHRV